MERCAENNDIYVKSVDITLWKVMHGQTRRYRRKSNVRASIRPGEGIL